ncbi:MAG: hypothetical protein GXP55_07445 [Deltaproteobacteria bacterium]|nr:hypothetical protein [Deltaproteobacteria bacterium]
MTSTTPWASAAGELERVAAGRAGDLLADGRAAGFFASDFFASDFFASLRLAPGRRTSPGVVG